MFYNIDGRGLLAIRKEFCVATKELKQSLAKTEFKSWVDVQLTHPQDKAFSLLEIIEYVSQAGIAFKRSDYLAMNAQIGCFLRVMRPVLMTCETNAPDRYETDDMEDGIRSLSKFCRVCTYFLPEKDELALSIASLVPSLVLALWGEAQSAPRQPVEQPPCKMAPTLIPTQAQIQIQTPTLIRFTPKDEDMRKTRPDRFHNIDTRRTLTIRVELSSATQELKQSLAKTGFKRWVDVQLTHPPDKAFSLLEIMEYVRLADMALGRPDCLEMRTQIVHFLSVMLPVLKVCATKTPGFYSIDDIKNEIYSLSEFCRVCTYFLPEKDELALSIASLVPSLARALLGEVQSCCPQHGKQPRKATATLKM